MCSRIRHATLPFELAAGKRHRLRLTSFCAARSASLQDGMMFPSRRGACPSLKTPMQTGDGLLVRLPLAGRDVRPGQMLGLAAAARAHGNGIVEITRRGSLQIRGCTDTTARSCAAAIDRLDLDLPADFAVTLAGLAGLDAAERADPRPVARAIEAAVAATSLVRRLPPKASVAVDGGGEFDLTGVPADVGVRACDDGRWQLGIGTAAGTPIETAAVAAAVVAALETLAAAGPASRTASPRPLVDTTDIVPVGTFAIRGGRAVVGVAAPFGATCAEALQRLAGEDVAFFRLGQGGLLFAVAPRRPAAFAAHAEALGFLTRADDPRLRIAACPGTEGCASGLVPARRIALALATSGALPPTLHVSGCGKGCANPGRAALTFVGVPGGLDVVRHGTARDRPSAHVAAPGTLAGWVGALAGVLVE